MERYYIIFKSTHDFGKKNQYAIIEAVSVDSAASIADLHYGWDSYLFMQTEDQFKAEKNPVAANLKSCAEVVNFADFYRRMREKAEAAREEAEKAYKEILYEKDRLRRIRHETYGRECF